MDKEIDFVLVKNRKKSKSPIFGRGTIVVRRMASDIEFVEKSIKPNGFYAKNSEKWLNTNVRAKKISDEIRRKNNPTYSVPKTFISHGKVKEEAVDGIMLGDVPKDWLVKNCDWIYSAIANFINDMSELQPVQKYNTKNNNLGFLDADNLTGFQRFLNSRGKNFISPGDKRILGQVYAFLRDLPENQELVFGHNDLHQKNIMIDMKNKKLYVIDFEMAGWRPKIWGLYCQISSPKIWMQINQMPKHTNPDLKWDFNNNVFMLVKFMRWFQGEMQMNFCDEQLKQDIKDYCKKAEHHLRLAQLDMLKNVRQSVNSTALVQASLYQKN